MNRTRPDHYTDRARQAGYPARSVYKLEEIQKKFQVLRHGQKVLDIGAAPGSWSMYASEQVGRDGRITSVDLKECTIEDRRGNIQVLEGDAFSENIQNELKKSAPYDTILSDAAPSTTGNRMVDTARSAGLAEQCIETARTMLAPGGNMVIKIFQGGEEQNLVKQLRGIFRNVKPFKPGSSRKDSFELFLVSTGFQGSKNGEKKDLENG